MSFFKSTKTKIVALIGTAMVTSFLLSPMLKAETSEEYLKIIAENTTNILTIVEKLPSQLEPIIKMAYSWLQTQLPTEDSVATMQTNFSKLSALVLENFNNQTSLQPQLVAELFAGVTPTNVPHANDLTFQTLLGMPLFEQDPRNKGNQNQKAADPKLEFMKYASGIKVVHFLPEKLAGQAGDQLRYHSFYNTVMAVESYNAYLLSSLYEDFRVQDDPNNADPNQRIKSLSGLQNQLLSQATAATWFTQVSTQELGLVFRQLLLFESQVYVLLTQLVQTQKQLLIAQAMGNTLTIASGIYDERNLFDAAQTGQGQ